MSAPDLLLVAFNALEPSQQEETFELISQARVRRRSAEETEDACFIRAVQRAAEVAGKDPSPDDYKRVRLELREQGEELPEFNKVVRHWGTWVLAKAAAALSERGLTAKEIEARFLKRRVGKVHWYREETLCETLAACYEHYGHVPLVAEFKAWRDREHELAKEQGRDLRLPSDSPYRRRYGSWERALLHFGYTQEEYAARLEEGREHTNAANARYRLGRLTPAR